VFSSFFRTIPEELREATIMDGAGEFTLFFRVYVPLSAPVFATIGLWVGMAQWNSFYDTMLYTINPDLITLQYFLMKVIKQASKPEGANIPASVYENVSDQTISFAAIVIATLPVLAVFPLLQKMFNKGVMVGSLKG
jgi:putative aldouronate transport system permease protein